MCLHSLCVAPKDHKTVQPLYSSDPHRVHDVCSDNPSRDQVLNHKCLTIACMTLKLQQ